MCHYELSDLNVVRVFLPPPSRHVVSHHEKAGEAAVQPHLPAGLLAATQHFPAASSPGPHQCRTQW